MQKKNQKPKTETLKKVGRSRVRCPVVSLCHQVVHSLREKLSTICKKKNQNLKKSRKVAGSIPGGVIVSLECFIDVILPAALLPWDRLSL